MKRRGAISQREARRLRARVIELEGILERQRNAYARDWPAGVHIASVHTATDCVRTAVTTARKLGHAVVVTQPDGQRLDFIAIPHPKT